MLTIRFRIFPDFYYCRQTSGQEVFDTKDSYTSDSDDDIVENEDERKEELGVEMEKSNDGSVWMNVSDIKFIESVWFPNRFKLLDKNRF